MRIRALIILAVAAWNTAFAYTEFYCMPSRSIATNRFSGHTTNAPHFLIANCGWNATTGILTPPAGNPAASNIIAGADFMSVMADGATETPFVALVTGTNTTTVTVSLSAKSGTAPGTAGSGITAIIGGPWYGPFGAVSFPAGFAQATMTNANGETTRINFQRHTSPVSMGIQQKFSQVGPLVWEGFTNSAGDGGLAIYDGTSFPTANEPFVVWEISGNAQEFKNFILDKNWNGTPSVGRGTNGLVNITCQNLYMCRIVVSNSYRNGIQLNGVSDKSGITLEECWVFNANADDASSRGSFEINEESTLIRCGAIGALERAGGNKDNVGFYISSSSGEPVTLINCIAGRQTKHGIEISAGAPVNIIGGITYSNLDNGIHLNSGSTALVNIFGHLSLSNRLHGIAHQTTLMSGAGIHFNYCAFLGNGSGAIETSAISTQFERNTIAITADPLVDVVNGNFQLNNVAGAGAALRNAAIGAFMPSLDSFTAGTTNYMDVGAAQHLDSGGGGTVYVTNNVAVPIFRR